MSKLLISALIACLALTTSVSVTTAQDAPKKADKKDKKEDKKEDKKAATSAIPFKSPKGYAINPPEGWTVVSAYMTKEQLAELPEKVRAQFRPEKIDVLFMDQSVQKVGSAFGDNLNIVVIADKLPLDDKTLAELKAVLVGQYTQLFDSFELTDYGLAKIGGTSMLRIQGKYRLNDHDLHLHQVFIPGPKNSLVVTCTMDRARTTERVPLCEAAAATIKFD
jgi:hypothetical protein